MPADHKPRRFLAIDLGDARTGLAVGDSQTTLVTPAGQLNVPIAHQNGEALLDAIARACDKLLGPGGALVLGLPLNMDGTTGPRARLVVAFAQRIRERTARPVHLQDERLTSADAEWSLSGSGLTHNQKKRRRDQIAATRILQDFLARQSEPSTSSTRTDDTPREAHIEPEGENTE